MSRVLGALGLTRRGIGFVLTALVTFLLAPILSAPALLYATGLLIGLTVLATLFVVGGHARVRVERQLSPQIVDPGQPVRARLTVTNTAGLPCPEATWSEGLPYVIAGRAGGVLPSLGPAGSADAAIAADYSISSSTRGDHHVGPVRIRLVDPFGLVERNREIGGTHVLTVLPRRYDLPAIRPRGSSDDGATRPAPQHVGVGDDDVIARAYLPGDALKRLHWKATARRGELMVRQEEQQLNPRAAVLVDLDASAHDVERDRAGGWEHSAGLEWCIATTASVVTHLVRAGYSVTTCSIDGQVDAEVSDNGGTLRDVMVALARCTPSDVDSWRTSAERVTFVVAGRLDVDRARRWVDELRSATSVHAMVAASTREPAVAVLEAAGWHVVSYTPQSDIPDTWQRLDQARAHAAG